MSNKHFYLVSKFLFVRKFMPSFVHWFINSFKSSLML